MPKYFIIEKGNQVGPFSYEDLQVKSIQNDTMIWFEGLDKWVRASEVAELKDLFKTPPPYQPSYISPVNQNLSEESGSGWKALRIVAFLIVGVVGVIFLISFLSNPHHNKFMNVDVHPPQARIMESHANEDPSSKLFAYREGVYCTVLNEGGAGRLLVTATLTQGTNTYERTQEVYLNGNQSQEIHFVFTEPHALGGDMKYEITAKPL